MQAGFLLRQLQQGLRLNMPDSRPMPSIGPRCHELRIPDPETDKIWRVVYRLDVDAVLVAEIFAKKTQQTPQNIIDRCQSRFKHYDALEEEKR